MDLTRAEGRVLGCLIETKAVDPDAYPMTLNALRLTCNQTADRVPVVAYDDRTVGDTLMALKSKGLARFVSSGRSEHSSHFSHRADERWRMSGPELAVLATLLLHGPQTVDEVRRRAQRLNAFPDPAEVDAVLDTLAARTPKPFAARVADRASGGGIKWAQVLTGPPAAEPVAPGATRLAPGGRGREQAAGVNPEVAPSYAELVERVSDLEHRLVTSIERAALPSADWSAPPPPPPPPPGADGGGSGGGGLGTHPELVAGTQAAPGVLAAGRDASSLAAFARDMADRMADIERRLARVEAELSDRR